MSDILSQDKIDAFVHDREDRELQGLPAEALAAFTILTEEFPDASTEGDKALELIGLDSYEELQAFGLVSAMASGDPAANVVNYIVGYLAGYKQANGRFPVVPSRTEVVGI